MLIYYGAADERWLRSKILDLRKSTAWGRTKPLRVSAVMIGEPMTPEKQEFRTREVELVINAIGHDRQDLLDTFPRVAARGQGG
jgi:hypothetical protein